MKDYDDDEEFDILQEKEFGPSITSQTEIEFKDPSFQGTGSVQEFIRQSVSTDQVFTDDAISDAEKFLERQKRMETARKRGWERPNLCT